MSKAKLVIYALAVLPFVIGIFFYNQFPDLVATHWNAAGHADDYSDKFWGVFLLPIVALAFLGLFLLIPRIDPLKKNIEKFKEYFDGFIIAMLLFWLYIFMLALVWNVFFEFNMTKAFIPALGFLFYYIGTLLKHTKQNWFVGIRTPWTLSSKKVWDKTHELGAVLFKVCGMFVVLGVFFLDYVMWFILLPVFGTVIFLFAYSYFEYKKTLK